MAERERNEALQALRLADERKNEFLAMLAHELSLARRIRAGLGERTPLLIALTGYGSHADRQAALDAGFDHYLVKPANIQQLESLLARPQASLG